MSVTIYHNADCGTSRKKEDGELVIDSEGRRVR
jgi:hypothetical protein